MELYVGLEAMPRSGIGWILGFCEDPCSGLSHRRGIADFLGGNGSWNSQAMDVVEILKIRASPRQGDDVLAWGPGKLGTFSVKSAYDMAFEESCRATAQASSYASNGRRACWKLIWGTNVPPKLRILRGELLLIHFLHCRIKTSVD